MSLSPFAFPGPATGSQWLPVADMILKATVLLAAAAVASLALRRASAAVRHLIWTLGITSTLLVPALALTLPRWQVPLVTLSGPSAFPAGPGDASGASAPSVVQQDSERVAAAVRATSADGASESARRGAFPPSLTWQHAAIGLWLAGVLAILGRLALGLAAVQWLSRQSAPVVEAPWLPLARGLAGELGIGTRVAFLRSASATMPMSWGLLKPSILMPVDVDDWPFDRLRIVLLHELAHVRRRDCLTHALAQVACAVYWFNPLVWIAARHLRMERERACDDLVLAAGTCGPDYADQLLELARAMRGGRFPGLLTGTTLAMAHRSQLEGRLMAILDPSTPRSGVTRVRAAGVTALVVCALMPLASMQPWAYAGGAVRSTEDRHDAQGARPAPVPKPEPAPEPGARGDLTGKADRTTDAAMRRQSGEAQAAGPKADPRTVAALTAALKDPDAGVRGAAMQALVQLRDPSIVEPLIAALQDTSPDVREHAAAALGEMRDKRAVDPLIAALRDASPDVREHAAAALGEMRDKRAVQPLAAALKDENAGVREQAVAALAELRDKGTLPALIAVLADGNAEVREKAAFALGELRDPSAIDGLVTLLRDEKPDVREQAVFALGQIRDARALDPLISALKDADAEVRQQAAFALGELRDRRALEPLVFALKDPEADVREQAAFALGELRDPRAIDPLTAALKDASPDVRQQAAFALGQIAR
jgi:HEAT repeat protein/beta-lactamase regulating signal transducer with metallopeptidase domain